MTDTPVTPEINSEFLKWWQKQPRGSYGTSMIACEAAWNAAMLLNASAIVQAVQAERAKRGELIERACQIARSHAKLANDTNYLDETKKYSREVAAEYCEEVAREIRALDPEATQAFDALRERERKLRELAEEWETVSAKRMMNGPALNDIYHFCADRLRAVLAETEGL